MSNAIDTLLLIEFIENPNYVESHVLNEFH